MRKCLKCKTSSEAFYPNNAICKSCITLIRKEKKDNREYGINRANRTQEALRILINQFQLNGEPYVYLIEAASRYKIGYSKNVDKRIRAFNTANCTPCRIIAVAPGDKQLEKHLHVLFKGLRVNKEWFLNAPSILTEFEKLTGVMIFLPGYIKQ